MARNFITASNQFINFPSISGLLGTTYSGAVRFKAPSVTAGALRCLVGHRHTSQGFPINFQFDLLTTGELRISVRDDANVINSDSAAIITANKWHSGVFIRNGNTVQSFLDSVGTGGNTVTLGAITATPEFDIGAITAGTSSTRVIFFEGDIAEVAFWDVVLTQAEIDSYHNGMNPLLIRPQNLIFYAPLWGTTQEADLSGTGNVGTLNGSPAISGFHSPTGLFKKRNLYYQSSHLPSGFCVSGIVQENGGNVARTVRVYLSSTGALLGSTVSNASTGEYEICNLPSAAEVFVVAFDDASGDSFNAKIFDKVIPVIT